MVFRSSCTTKTNLSSSPDLILSLPSISNPATACSRVLVSPTNGNTWVRGGTMENRTSPLLQPAASGKISIKAHVLGAFLQLMASFLPLEKRGKWDDCPGKEVLSWPSMERASLWGTREERGRGCVRKGDPFRSRLSGVMSYKVATEKINLSVCRSAAVTHTHCTHTW